MQRRARHIQPTDRRGKPSALPWPSSGARRIFSGASERGVRVRAELSQPGRAGDFESDRHSRLDDCRCAEGTVSRIGWSHGDVGGGTNSPVNRPLVGHEVGEPVDRAWVDLIHEGPESVLSTPAAVDGSYGKESAFILLRHVSLTFMATDHILALLLIERNKLTAAIEALQGPRTTEEAPGPGRKPVLPSVELGSKPQVAVGRTAPAKRKMSAAGRRAITAGIKKRWAAIRAAKELLRHWLALWHPRQRWRKLRHRPRKAVSPRQDERRCPSQ